MMQRTADFDREIADAILKQPNRVVDHATAQIDQRQGFLSLEARWTINRDKLDYKRDSTGRYVNTTLLEPH